MAMEISSAYNSYASTYTNGTESKAATKTDKTNSSSVAKAGTSDYLVELQKKNPKLNLLTGYSNGTPGSSNYPEKVNVTIAPEFLAKMESDPKLAAEYEKNLADIPAACKWGESMIRSMTGNTVYEFRFYIDENGNMSAGSVSGPSEKREMFERSRQKAKQQKEEFDKRIEERIKASAEKREETEKDTLHTHEVRITGNDVRSLTEKLVAVNAPANNSSVSGIIGVDIKI
ncbi:MAG: hypothetical protein K2N00_11465 [Lachnospiraceae bacterium]|nr:hypothetical protein [Lachnospiraceae bacterium]